MLKWSKQIRTRCKFHVLNFACPANQQYSAHVDVKENLWQSQLAQQHWSLQPTKHAVDQNLLTQQRKHAIFKVSFVERDWLVSRGHNGFAACYDVQWPVPQQLEHGSGMWSVDVSDTLT